MIYWDRITLKERAKVVLKKSYWMSFLVMFIMAIVGGGRTTPNFSFNFGAADFNPNLYNGQVVSGLSEIPHSLSGLVSGIAAGAVISAISLVAILAAAFGIIYSVFVGNIFEIGKNRFFTLCRYDSINIDEIIYGFKNGKYMSNVKTQFIKNLYIFLWSLLFIIPGIIKSLAYFMVPFILAENPNLSTERVLEISEKTTQGEKWEIFVMGLSFIGWYLLGALACGIGVLFVNPYYEAARAELYGALRLKAVQTGIATKDEIGAEL